MLRNVAAENTMYATSQRDEAAARIAASAKNGNR